MIPTPILDELDALLCVVNAKKAMLRGKPACER